MATIATNKTPKASSLNWTFIKAFVATAFEKTGDSIGDMIITVAVLGMSIAYMFQTIAPHVIARVLGLYIAGMIVQLLIRIVHRFDDSYTTDELAERVIEFEQSINERLDRIIANE